jgi:hypothetical protein
LEISFCNSSQLKQNKEFQKATEYVPLTKYASGQISLQEFEDCTKRAAHIEDLKSSGLTGGEVQLLLDYGKGKEFFYSKYKRLEGSVLNSRLEQVFSKIKSSEEKHKLDNSKLGSVKSVIVARKILVLLYAFILVSFPVLISPKSLRLCCLSGF